MTSVAQNMTARPEIKATAFDKVNPDMVLKSSVNQRLAAANAHQSAKTNTVKADKFTQL